MKFWKLVYCVSLSACSFASCAQTKPVIKSITAYYYERLPGMIAVHPDGTPRDHTRDTTLLAFAEIEGRAPQWKQAWKGSMFYLVNATMVVYTPTVVGRSKNSNRELILQPSTGNTLWKLELMPQTSYRAPKQLIGENEILLEGIFKNKTFYQKVIEQIEIAPPQYQ